MPCSKAFVYPHLCCSGLSSPLYPLKDFSPSVEVTVTPVTPYLSCRRNGKYLIVKPQAVDDSRDESVGASKDGEEDNTTAGVMVPEIKAVM